MECSNIIWNTWSPIEQGFTMELLNTEIFQDFVANSPLSKTSIFLLCTVSGCLLFNAVNLEHDGAQIGDI